MSAARTFSKRGASRTFITNSKFLIPNFISHSSFLIYKNFPGAERAGKIFIYVLAGRALLVGRPAAGHLPSHGREAIGLSVPIGFDFPYSIPEHCVRPVKRF